MYVQSRDTSASAVRDIRGATVAAFATAPEHST